jgi:L-lactate dehydrogenase complex protein LldG
MSRAREEILGRIRTALADRPAPRPIPRDYLGAGSAQAGSDELADLFAERVGDYRASVHRADSGDARAAIERILRERAVTPLVVPDGFPPEWLPGVELLHGVDLLHEPLTVEQLDQTGGVLTSCAVAVAETGTIVLDAGPGQGPRMLTLVPDYHLVVVRHDQIVAGVPDAIAALDPTRPLTWISGPSATSDIELDRVEGVHGPRTLDVLLLASPASPIG